MTIWVFYYVFRKYIVCLLAAPGDIQDLSSPARDCIHAPAVEAQS